jgi:endoglucanase
MDNLEYYLSRGFNIFRIPFKWDRLQPDLNGPLDEDALAGLDQIVRTVTTAGAIAVLDSHDYGRRARTVIGTPDTPITLDAFANFWQRMATRYGGNRLVWYNLMNEPHDQDPMLNLAAQNGACAAIRRAGGRSKVLFSGINWSGAKSWVKSGNAQTMLSARDPANNYGFDVHQYLDQSHLGKDPDAMPGIGGRVLTNIYQWAKANNKKLFLGEFSVNANPHSLREVDLMLEYMAERTDVFLGATYFAGGGTWGRNPNSMDPVDGVDKPQLRMLKRYL